MEEQQMNIDDIFRQSGLGGRGSREMPPPAVWDKIAQRLDEGEEHRKRRAILWLRWPAAIVAVLLLGVGLWRVVVADPNTRPASATIDASGTTAAQTAMAATGGENGAEPSDARRAASPAAILLAQDGDHRERTSIQPRDRSSAPAAVTQPQPYAAIDHSEATKELHATGSVHGAAVPVQEAFTVAKPVALQPSVSAPATMPVGAAQPHVTSGITVPKPVVEAPFKGGADPRLEAERPLAAGHPSGALAASATVALANAGGKSAQGAVTREKAPLARIENKQPVLWPAHMAPARVTVSPLAVLHDRMVAAAKLVEAIASPVLEYDVVLSKPRPAGLPLFEGSAAALPAPAALSFAGLAGFEPGTGGPLQYRISVAGRLMWHFPASPWSIGIQPALRIGQLSSTMLSDDKTYQRTTTDVNGKILAAVSPSILGTTDTLYSYVVRQTVDSIVVSGQIAKGSIWEVELPLLLDFRTGAWHFRGGPSLNFGGPFTVGGGVQKTYSTVRRDSIVQSVPMPVAAFANYFGAPSSLPQYSTATTSEVSQVADIRTGYLIGIGWQRGRWMLDASVHGQLTGYRQVAEPMRKAYEGPAVRLSVGYELFRAAMKKNRNVSDGH